MHYGLLVINILHHRDKSVARGIFGNKDDIPMLTLRPNKGELEVRTIGDTATHLL